MEVSKANDSEASNNAAQIQLKTGKQEVPQRFLYPQVEYKC
jgi:hypothetical protein